MSPFAGPRMPSRIRPERRRFPARASPQMLLPDAFAVDPNVIQRPRDAPHALEVGPLPIVLREEDDDLGAVSVHELDAS